MNSNEAGMPATSLMQLPFEPIDLSRQSDYQKKLSQCSQIASDYSFVNLWGWQEEYGLSWAWEDDLVWIRQRNPRTVLWAPVGPWEAVDWQRYLFARLQGPLTIIRVPQKLVELWRAGLEGRARIESDRDHWDYLYDPRELIHLKGNRFHKKKNLLNQFVKKYDYQYVPLEPELVDETMGMQADWCNWRDCESSEVLSAENQAILKLFQNWSRLEGLLGGAIKVEQMVVAYTVGEALDRDTLLIHYEKGCTAHKGIYQAINQMFLAREGHRFRWVNREQDLGETGLRKAKLSYQPVGFLKKFRIQIP